MLGCVIYLLTIKGVPHPWPKERNGSFTFLLTEMWFYRIMLWAPWTDNKRNENMLKQMNSQQEWRTRIRKQNWNKRTHNKNGLPILKKTFLNKRTSNKNFLHALGNENSYSLGMLWEGQESGIHRKIGHSGGKEKQEKVNRDYASTAPGSTQLGENGRDLR